MGDGAGPVVAGGLLDAVLGPTAGAVAVGAAAEGDGVGAVVEDGVGVGLGSTPNASLASPGPATIDAAKTAVPRA